MKTTVLALIGKTLVLPLFFIVLFSVTAFGQAGSTGGYYPANGEDLLGNAWSKPKGRHAVTIENNNSKDAIVKLEDTSTGETYRLVFVRRGQTYKISEVRDGTFIIKFALGSDYSPSQKIFLRGLEVMQFDEADTLQTTWSGNTVYYSTLTVSLAPVVGGNADSTKINPRDF
jgi:hypothetical protein